MIRDYIDSQRTPMIREALDVNPDLPVPDTLIIWKKYKYKPQIGSFSEEKGSGYDKAVIHKVRTYVSFYFSNHTLRRTFARMAYEAGATLEEIGAVLGHKDKWTTMRYIGLTIEHQAKGLRKLSGMLEAEKTKIIEQRETAGMHDSQEKVVGIKSIELTTEEKPLENEGKEKERRR